MQLSYELTLAEFKSALNLHARQKLGRRIHTFIYKFGIPGITALLLGLTFYTYITGGSDAAGDMIVYDIGLVTIVVLVFVLRRFRIRSAFRSLFPAGAKNRTTSIAINDDHILTSVQGVGEARYLWTGLSAFVQNKLVALFYIGDERFLVLPLRAISPSQRNELNDLIGRYVTRR
ncbi:MAG: YcxB family protein [Terracidiphilus sp.]